MSVQDDGRAYSSPEMKAYHLGAAERMRERLNVIARERGLNAGELAVLSERLESALARAELGTAERMLDSIDTNRLPGDDDGAPVDERPPERDPPESLIAGGMIDPFPNGSAMVDGDPWALLRDETGDASIGRDGPGATGLELVSDDELVRGLNLVLVAFHAYYPPVRDGARAYETPLLILQGHALTPRGGLGKHVNVKVKSYLHAALVGEMATAGVALVDLDAKAWRRSLPPKGSTDTGTWWPVLAATRCPVLGMLDVKLTGRAGEHGARADNYAVKLWRWTAPSVFRGLARRDPSWRAFPDALPSEGPLPPARGAVTPPDAEPSDLVGERQRKRAAPSKGPPKRAPKGAPKGGKRGR